MQDEAFSRRLREARKEAVDHAVIRLQKAASEAVTVLRDLMMKDDAPASARISAARTVLDYTFHTVEVDDLRSRIDSLEDFIKTKQEEDKIDASLKDEAEEE